MEKKALWIGLMILVLVLAGCGKPTVKYATLCGWIINAADEMPISGATVSIDGKVMACTNEAGWFETGRFQIGVRELQFSAENYNTEAKKVRFSEAGDFWLLTEGYNPGQIPLNPFREGQILPTKVYDLPVINGSGEVTISAQQQIDSLLLIPYNTSMSYGTYSATLTIEKRENDGIIKQEYLLNSWSMAKSLMISGENTKEAFYQRLREIEREAIQAQLEQGGSFGLSREMLFGEQVPVLGDQLTFYKVIGSNYRVAVEATRKYVSDHTYIYLDNHFQAEISDQTIEDLGRAFDEYYEKLVEAFAPVAMDVDGYPGIFYLLSELENSGGSYVAGYFWGGNEFRKVDVPESNEKEVLFLTTFGYDEANPEAWAERIKSTMAHELQHLINFTNRVPKIWNYDQLEQYETETWINEGLSMVAEDLVMNWDNSLLDEQRVIPYLENPAADSLCTWANQLADYAPAYMFMRYFVDRFGTGIIQDLLHSNQFGLASVVSASGEGSFIPLFRDWLTAVYVSCQDPAIKNEFQAYNYYQKDLSTLEASLNVEDFSAEISIPDTTGQFIVLDDLGLANEIRISMEGSSKFKLRVIMFPTAEASFNSCQFQLQKVR